jgi:hypothetical protein
VDWFDRSNWTDDYVELPGAPVPTIVNDVYFNGGIGDCVLTDDIVCKRLLMDATLYTGLLDCVAYNVVTGEVRAARIKLGSGSHIISGDLMGALDGVGHVELESCGITIAGNVDLRNLFIDDVLSTMTLVSSSGGVDNITLYFSDIPRVLADDSEPLGDLVIDKPGGLVTMMNDGSVANFIGVSGDFDFNGFALKVGY